MKVNAIIIGAGRSGTTTVYEHLKNHKQIAFSKIKEIHFFSIDELFDRGEKYYHSFFTKKNETKIFAAADTYLFAANEKIIYRLQKYNPKIKIIILLRNPIKRAFSGFQYALYNGYLENINFIDACLQEHSILNNNPSIADINNLCNLYQSKYFFHLSKWKKFFPDENFIFIKTQDLKDKPLDSMNKICNFLEINNFANIKNIQANRTQSVKSKKLEQFFLDRDKTLRKFLRKNLPEKLKLKILKSGLIDTLHKLNKSNVIENKMNTEEKIFAEKYLADDMKLLKEKFNISFK